MTVPHCHTPRWPHPGNSLSVFLQVLLCPHQIPGRRSPRGYSPGSQTTGTTAGTSHTPALPWIGSGEAGALGTQQVTHPLSFSEWRLGIKKQSKGGKRQASSLSTRPPSPALPNTRTSQIPIAPNLHTPIRPRVANTPQCQVDTWLEMQDGNNHKQGHTFVCVCSPLTDVCSPLTDVTHALTHTCAHPHIYTCTHMHAHSHTCTHVQPPKCTRISTHMLVHLHTHAHTYGDIHAQLNHIQFKFF